MAVTVPTGIRLLIVGDELLSGKRRDGHLVAVIERLRTRGLALAECRIVGDEEDAIAASIRDAVDAGAVLLSCGGIGGTPDDRTRQAAARAFDRGLLRHPQAAEWIEQRYGERAYPQRIRMADFPSGAELIPNPVNQVAGFSVGHCHFVPGFPEMAWPMIDWVLDTHYRAMQRGPTAPEARLEVRGRPTEGDFVALMEACLLAFPAVAVSSLPSRGRAPGQGRIEVGFRGDDAARARDWFAERAAAVDGAELRSLDDY